MESLASSMTAAAESAAILRWAVARGLMGRCVGSREMRPDGEFVGGVCAPKVVGGGEGKGV